MVYLTCAELSDGYLYSWAIICMRREWISAQLVLHDLHIYFFIYICKRYVTPFISSVFEKGTWVKYVAYLLSSFNGPR
jgi:hypothetical protein